MNERRTDIEKGNYMEKWIETRKGADFFALAQKFNIDPVTARLIRNRDVVGEEEMQEYLHGTKDSLHNPKKMKNLELAAGIMADKIKEGKSIRIIGDYDIDGVNASYILYKGILRCHGDVSLQIPDRLKDGYGINENLIQEAKDEGIDTIITCDNGIAALDAIAFAKKLQMTVLVTDHHDIPYEETDGIKNYLQSNADAIVNPHQPGCEYPFKELCGAAVAWKFILVLYELFSVPEEEGFSFIENAAFATIGDVMDLKGENRLIVRLGLERIHHTQNEGLKALILQNKLEIDKVSSYHIGFVLGPCMNASGRLDTAKRSFDLLKAQTPEQASLLASDLIGLNDSRKSMTLAYLENAYEVIEQEKRFLDKVIIVYLKDCHESLAGIIAGRIREKYNHPVFVLTKGEESVKGSGRSVEAYSMYEEMVKCKELFLKFGGHPMAAGLSIEEKNIEVFREKLNQNCTLKEEDFAPIVHIDVAMPISYVTMQFAEQLDLLEPYGKGNTKPVFADKNIGISFAKEMGKNHRALRLELVNDSQQKFQGVYFGETADFFAYVEDKFGNEERVKMEKGLPNDIRLSIVYYPKINEYNGNRNLQIVISRYR